MNIDNKLSKHFLENVLWPHPS